MKFLFAFLALAPGGPAFAEDKPSAWQISPQPALVPGLVGEWDDFAIGSASVVRQTDGSTLFYEGTAFDANGLRTALGIAGSQDDGATWTKHSQNPLTRPGTNDPETSSDFSVTRWRDSYWCAYVAYSDPFRFEASTGRRGDGSVGVRTVHSKDGLIWSPPVTARAPVVSMGSPTLKPCLVGDENALHLWWLDEGEEGKPALAHALSRDGTTWSPPNYLPTSAIDPRRLCCVRVHHSGDFYIVTGVAYDERSRDRPHTIVTKTSSNARTWTANGPPEFPLVGHERHAVPVAVFSSAGARIFFHVEREGHGVELRSAFCRKEHYVGR